MRSSLQTWYVFVLTVDQVGSRREADRVAAVEADAAHWADEGAVRGPDRTAGDEFQLLFAEIGRAHV